MPANPRLLPLPNRLEVEDVKKSHRKACESCDMVPEVRRIKETTGAGRRAVTVVYCINCGLARLRKLQGLLERGERVLATGAGSIRRQDRKPRLTNEQ